MTEASREHLGQSHQTEQAYPHWRHPRCRVRLLGEKEKAPNRKPLLLPVLQGHHRLGHSTTKANFTLVPRISAETNPINVKERPNILLVSASC